MKWNNQYKRSRNSYAGQPGGSLSRDQKATLCILAKEAYPLSFSDLSEDEWRRQEQYAAIGKHSLRDCTQRDYLPLKSHFLRLAGEPGDALRVENRIGTEDHRVVFHKLKQICTERNLDLSYAAAIAKSKYKCTLAECSPNQLWTVLFTIKNRRKA